MSLDAALFLVQRGGTNYHSKGSDIGDRMVAGDTVLVQRGTDRFKATYTPVAGTKFKTPTLSLPGTALTTARSLERILKHYLFRHRRTRLRSGIGKVLNLTSTT